MWDIFELKDFEKVFWKLPDAVQRKYELWKSIVQLNGPHTLRKFKGFYDEKLKGKRAHERSSRLSLKYRVIYTVEWDALLVRVEEITPHHY
ncbi:MAG: type II toxin-antitoxin system mRNA interferase toxin, RelE/StbE family [Chlamydiae bacterium]|nr:type II toxin-antitoxin system mRNA interferase toxin, RelE/StbE family [Chlamydiota bacterium]MBI3266840.1 type II toxin-antitoxin system mRNA interferase toxin, RelE/StbE family [Chlamydiota bacterium]